MNARTKRKYEHAVIGLCLLSEEWRGEVLKRLGPGHLQSESLQQLLSVVADMRKSGATINALSVAERIQSRLSKTASWTDIICRCLRSVPLKTDIETISKICRELKGGVC